MTVSDEAVGEALRILKEFNADRTDSDAVKIAKIESHHRLWGLGLVLGAIVTVAALCLWAIVDLNAPAQTVVHCTSTIIDGISSRICS